ncbi:isoprenoid synthase domain-containing protein [Suillus subalutaceus]|uniref:isoprenoid synthase domain-containing protein n=1 Tax=Suillus subalutaceus TaxID=48586 RepID=UPI001B8818DD|nr:isoprenoid synthase domain-containing protein [Suillus subalutaceus]KAG1852763.1 isoprenoid synthase domain-containing protein [Suillus subalutaceus]
MNPTTAVMFPTVAHTTNSDSEPAQFILPDLINDCHYPLRQNPHRDAVSRATNQWLVDVGQLVEPEIRGYLDADIGGCAAVCYPDADAFHLQVCAEWLIWAFIVDDWMECGVADVQEVHEYFNLAIRDPINFDTEQSAALGKLPAPAAQSGFIRTMGLFFAAVAKNLDDRAKGHMYNLQSFLTLRRNLIGTKPCFALVEFVAVIDLPDEVVSHPVVMALEEAALDYAIWSNDVFSYNKEQSRGSAPWENIVAVTMYDRGLDLQGAMDYAGQMCKDAIQRFESNRVILPSWEEEVDRQVAIYVEGLQNVMVGSLNWYPDCPRYVGKDGHAIKRDRIVKLLPKRPLL